LPGFNLAPVVTCCSKASNLSNVTDVLFNLVFLVGNLVDFPFFVYVTVNVTVGVSGFEGREVFFEVIWHCNIQTAWG
jgi:hypothetical protein